jgi:hypothetical protein
MEDDGFTRARSDTSRSDATRVEAFALGVLIATCVNTAGWIAIVWWL